MDRQERLWRRKLRLFQIRKMPDAEVEAVLRKATAKIYERVSCKGGKPGKWSYEAACARTVLRERDYTPEQIEAVTKKHKVIERLDRKYGLA